MKLKEAAESDDPLRSSPEPKSVPPKHYYRAALLLLTPGISALQNHLVEAIALILLLALALLLSALRAAYAVTSANEVFWERRNAAEPALLDAPQKLTLSLLQRFVTLTMLVVGAGLSWGLMVHPQFSRYAWVPLVLLVVWLWADALFRFLAGRYAAGFTQKSNFLVQPLLRLLLPVGRALTIFGEKWRVLLPDESHGKPANLDNYAENEEERDLLRGLASFGQTTARQAMQPRLNITAVNMALDFHELMDKINKSGYSRIPAYDDTLDSVEGILYVKDLLPHLHLDEHFAWQKLLRKAYFIPESKRLDDLMQEFQNRRVHMAIVIDEYGGTNGLITLEDIIEEIFGDINDEYDEAEEVKYTQVDEKTFIFEGKVHLNDFCKILDLDTDYFEDVRRASESLGGLLLELFSQLPRTGEEVTYEDLTFKIQSADKKRIKKVRVLVA